MTKQILAFFFCFIRGLNPHPPYYCLPPAGVLHSQNKVIKCAAYGVAQRRGIEVWVDRWAEGEGKGGVKGLSSRAGGDRNGLISASRLLCTILK
jgi:hypothetical protein